MKSIHQTLLGKCIYSVEDKETSTSYIIFYQFFSYRIWKYEILYSIKNQVEQKKNCEKILFVLFDL